MKKVLFILAITAAGGAANAQKIYVQGGANFANITKNNAGETSDNNILTTFNAGVMGRFGISKIFDLETGLLFTGRGAKAETFFGADESDNYVKAKFNPYYIELPVNAVVKLPLSVGGNSNVFVNAGPYVAMGVAGKSKVETKFVGVTSTSSENIKFNNDDPTTNQQEGAAYDRIKRFDFGLNFGAGIDFGQILVKANYGLGLSKISSASTDNSDNDKNKYRTLSVSVGIPLGR
jgi:hypothetical protein